MRARVAILIFLVAFSQETIAQDVHYADVQDMKIWYNPSLKTNKTTDLHADLRSVNYQGFTAYTSKAATIELPLASTERKETDNIPFANLAIGVNADNTTNSTLNVSTAMMSLSYALPLNQNNTYVALGFQANYTFSKVAWTGGAPGSFDQFGALGSAISSDPNQSGLQYNYFTAGAGISFFHTTSEKQWYVGASVRHFNQPYTDWTYTYRLPVNYGIQFGYARSINADATISGLGNFSWQGGVREQIIGALYTRNLDDSSRYALSLGLSFRVGDALIPNLVLKFGVNQISFLYEFNIIGSAYTASYNRTSFEFAYKLTL
jgi:type IX secretion system PorP/SprF family membrane protein